MGSPLSLNPSLVGAYQIAVDVPTPGTLALAAGGLLFLIRRQRVQPLQSGRAV
jgi:MYXO-CTERM domain-containing protein